MHPTVYISQGRRHEIASEGAEDYPPPFPGPQAIFFEDFAGSLDWLKLPLPIFLKKSVVF